MSAVVLLTLLIGYTFGHMCMLNPYQRGGLVPDDQLNNEGDLACGNANIHSNGTANGVPPCYGQYNDDERITSFIGRNAEQPMLIYKNVDHYNSSKPGNFTWNLYSYNGQTDSYKFLKELGAKDDTKSGPLTDYNIIATIPDNLEGEHFVVQTIYYTNSYIYSQTEITNFYQCADVLLI